MTRILIVEDEPAMAAALMDGFGYEIHDTMIPGTSQQIDVDTLTRRANELAWQVERLEKRVWDLANELNAAKGRKVLTGWQLRKHAARRPVLDFTAPSEPNGREHEHTWDLTSRDAEGYHYTCPDCGHKMSIPW